MGRDEEMGQKASVKSLTTFLTCWDLSGSRVPRVVQRRQAAPPCLPSCGCYAVLVASGFP